jgi:hypothetical protein
LIRVVMFRGFLSLLMASATVWALPPQPPAEVYSNKTTVLNPQVNARNFINEGSITAFGTRPWDSQNTINFTNRGSMFGAPGFRFENVDVPFGIRRPANSFFNSSAGEILAADTGGFALIIDGAGGTFDFSSTSLIKVNANSITNRGLLNVGANGFIQLHGHSVDLTAGALVVGDLDDPLSGGNFGEGFPSTFDTNFFPAAGIYDEAWAIGNYTNTRIAGIITGVDPTAISTPTPAPILTNDFGGRVNGSIRLDEALVWTREEVIDETNEVVQIIAVQVSDPNIGVLASFQPVNWWDDEPLGGFLTAVVELQVASTDFATFELVTNSLYIADQLGSSTNRALILNNRFGTFRPGNFVVFRDQPNLFGGLPPTGTREDILVRSLNAPPYQDYLGTIFTNDWAGYQASVESVAARLPVLPDVTVTNLGGQVEVYAQDLVMRNTRIRGEGFVTLNGTNVIINGENIIDAPRLGVNFGSGPGNLQINEFVPDFVERFNGTFAAYSTIFTNYYEITNVAPPADIYAEPTAVTNQVEVRFQVTIVDARGLQTREPVTVYDLKLTSTNGPASVFFNEDLTLLNDVRIDTRNLFFAEGSGLDIPFGLSYTNLINVQTFTNFGSIFAGEAADLRTSQNVPLQSFFNGGLLFANGVEIWAEDFGNSGGIISRTVIDLRARNFRIDGGFFDAVGDIRLSGENLTISNTDISSGARLVLDISGTLTDTGPLAPNTITVNAGVEMTPNRPSGDLLGTAITMQARPGDVVSLVWAGEDRGASASGFQNNLALGMLTLNGGRFSLFEFLPALEGSALYVDILEFSGTNTSSLAAITNAVILGMNVYYSDVVADPYSGVNAQSLNRIFGPDAPFNFIWVPDFIGPSSVEIRLGKDGAVTRMNRSVRQSMVIDSDGDGIPNAIDPYPLTTGTESNLELVNVKGNAANQSITFNLNGSPSAKYVIEYTTNLFSPDWKAITGTLTSSELSGSEAFSHSIGQTSAQGYYRVRVVP